MNTNTPVTPEIRPYVEILHGEIKTTSIKIAEHFGKQHKDVIRKIENIGCSPEFAERNFALSKYQVAGGKNTSREEIMYEITRDGFMFLAMGFTGAKAAQWKEAYILAFNRMESELQNKADPNDCDLFPVRQPKPRWLYFITNSGHQRYEPIAPDCLIMNREQFIDLLTQEGYFVAKKAELLSKLTT